MVHHQSIVEMQSKTILLSCALLAMLIAQLPGGQTVTCEVDPEDKNCIDCDDPKNDNHPECRDIGVPNDVPPTGTPRPSTTQRSPTRPPSQPPTRRPTRPPTPEPTVRPPTILEKLLELIEELIYP
ncbi:hypothetical protein KR093_004988 [Drosophila rubida]|uniref:Salivary glue protein Sgs-3 n=1 Tax=Drosophila rubida TaxID=30044 RepID=A0AAD4K5N7_9MUSC|nr:hypothetical protein KR093_004988 [Drosophila rubida]